MKNFSILVVLRKAASDYYRYLGLYVGVGIAVTFVGWWGHATTSYFSDRCGYLALRPASFDSLDVLLTYSTRLLHFHPGWFFGFVIACAVAKLVELFFHCSVYALALQISSGSSVTRKSLLSLMRNVRTVFARYVLATIFYGIIISFFLALLAAPWSFLSFLPFPFSLQMPVVVLVTGLLLFVLLRSVSIFYFYPYLLLDKNIGAWQSLQQSKEVVGALWKKVAVLAALLFFPLAGVGMVSWYFPTEWFGGVVLCGFLSVGVIASFTALAMAHVYRFLV